MKLLLISYYFPPQTSVGTFRLKRFADHLQKSGIELSVLSVQHPDKQFHPYIGDMPEMDTYGTVPVHRVKELPVRWLWQWPTRFCKMLAKLYGKSVKEGDIAARFWHIDMEWGWIRPARRKALALIEDIKPDAIMVSCPPFSSAEIGVWLKEQTGLPLILDFRDGWVAVSHYLSDIAKRDAAKEQAVLAAADTLIVTSDSDAQEYGKILGEEKVHLVYNGYHPSFASIPHTPRTEDKPLTLLYLGAWGVFGRSPEGLLHALKDMPFAWKLISIGHTNDIVERLAREAGVMEYVELVGNQPQDKLAPWIAKADALFLIKGAPKGGKDTHIAAKIYDYLATGKPILAQLPEGDSKAMLERYGNQCFIAPSEDGEALRAQLHALYNGSREVAEQQNNQAFLDAFSGEALTGQLADIVKRIVQ